MKLDKSYIFLLMLVISIFLSGCSQSKSYTERSYQFSAKFEIEDCKIKSVIYLCNLLPYSEAWADSFNPPSPPSIEFNTTVDISKLLESPKNKLKGKPISGLLKKTMKDASVETKIFASTAPAQLECPTTLIDNIAETQEKLQITCEKRIGNFPTGKPDKEYPYVPPDETSE